MTQVQTLAERANYDPSDRYHTRQKNIQAFIRANKEWKKFWTEEELQEFVPLLNHVLECRYLKLKVSEEGQARTLELLAKLPKEQAGLLALDYDLLLDILRALRFLHWRRRYDHDWQRGLI